MSTLLSFTTEEIETISQRYASGESALKIGSSFGCARHTILRALRRHGFSTRSTTKIWFSETQKTQIVTRYTQGEWAEEIAPDFHCGGATILRALDAWGIKRRERIPLRGPKGNKIMFSSKQQENILNLYAAGTSAKDIARTFNCTPPTIINTLKAHNVEIRLLRPKSVLSLENIKDLATLYPGTSLRNISKILHCSEGSIKSYLREHGLEVRRSNEPTKEKRCNKCREIKPVADYGRHGGTSDGLQPSCRSCGTISSRKSNLLRKFALTEDAYEKLAIGQSYKCTICGDAETRMHHGVQTLLSVDHDHATGATRQLLCHNCNIGLGNFKDNPEVLLAAAAYLKKHGK